MNGSKPCPMSTQYHIIPTDSDRDTPNKLFLGGVPLQATEKELEEFFRQFGTVKDVRIVTDRVTAECKGYGFVTFDENENIDKLLEKKAVRMNGKKIRIRRAIRRNGSQFDHVNASSSPISTGSVVGSPYRPMSPCVNTPPPLLLKPVHNLKTQLPNTFCSMLTPPPSPDHEMKPSTPMMNTQFVMSPFAQMEASPIIMPPLQIAPVELPMPSYQFVFNRSHVETPSYLPQPFVYTPRQCPQHFNPSPMHLSNSYQMHG